MIQSIPSPKAEPFKRWLAKVGYERIQEIEDPELATKRTRALYKAKGYSDDWIEKRMRSIAIRDELTDEWKKRGVKEQIEYAILTAEISKATFGMTPSQYAEFKRLKRENLRDHMTDLELIFSMLGEAASTEIARNRDAQGFPQNQHAAHAGGAVAAKQSGGNVLSGVLVGGTAGAISGYLGAQIADPTNASRLGAIVLGAGRGAIIGAGGGLASGYAGGKGNAASILLAMAEGAVLGGVLGGALGYEQVNPGLNNVNPIYSPGESAVDLIGNIWNTAINAGKSGLAQGVIKTIVDNPEIAYGALFPIVGAEPYYEPLVEQYIQKKGIPKQPIPLYSW